MTFPQARSDVDPTPPWHLVQIKRETAVQHAQMDGVVGHRRQMFQIGARHARQMHLLAGGVAQLQQLRAETVALAWAEGQQATIHQGRGQAVGGAARQLQLLGQLGQRQGAVDQRIDDIQTTQQGLAAGGLDPGFLFALDLLGLD
ncbi:hypothetical protein D3C86_1671460 [compost metagenome]